MYLALYIILGVIIVFLIIVALQPAKFTITRSASMAAVPGAVYAELIDFHKWRGWSPWEKLDPAMNKTFAGTDGEPGASYAWVGNKKVGEGKMTLLERKTNEMVRIQLQFFKPFAATNETVFTLKPDGGVTTVSWAMSGTHGFVAKAFCMFMNMDKLVGSDFEKGLAALKTIAETKS